MNAQTNIENVQIWCLPCQWQSPQILCCPELSTCNNVTWIHDTSSLSWSSLIIIMMSWLLPWFLCSGGVWVFPEEYQLMRGHETDHAGGTVTVSISWTRHCSLTSLTQSRLQRMLIFQFVWMDLSTINWKIERIVIMDHIYGMVIVEGCCTMARSSSLGANCSLVDTKV